MYNSTRTSKQLIIFIKLLLPVMIYQMISYSSSMIGTFMAGNYSKEELAGVSMGVNVWTPIFSVISTLVVALIPIVSQLIGENKHLEVATKVRQFMYVALISSLLVSTILFFSVDYLIQFVGIKEDIAHITRSYLKYQSFGLIPISLYVTLRSFIDSLGLTRVSMYVMLSYVPINVLLSYVFIFGKLGVNGFGGVGLAISTNLTYSLSLILLILVINKHKKTKVYNIFKFEKIKFEHWPEIFKLGLPMSFAVLLETFMFSILSLLVSRFDTATIAAHQASLNFAGFLYAMPMSISSALTIVVAYHIGAKNFSLARKYVKIGMLVSIVVSILIALIILTTRSYIPYLYGSDYYFIEISKTLLLYVVGFVIFDSFSGGFVGVLRAYKKVLPTCIFQFIGFYIIGIPIAIFLIFKTSAGVYGLWIAWLVGLFIYAVLMVSYYIKVLSKINK